MESIKTYFKNNAASVTVGVALILAVAVGGIFYLGKKAGGNTLTVTGSARMSVVADNVIWRTSITRNVGVADLKSGYAGMAMDLKSTQAFFARNGIPENTVTITPVSMMENYQQDGSAPKRYTLRQSIEINSGDVQKVTDIAKHVDDLINQGVLFQSDSLEYYYSKLNDVRVSLLTDATSDARARALAIAKSSKQSIGNLQSASSGVVQVLSKGSNEISDYGSYDTSKIDKDIMVTVRATFTVK